MCFRGHTKDNNLKWANIWEKGVYVKIENSTEMVIINSFFPFSTLWNHQEIAAMVPCIKKYRQGSYGGNVTSSNDQTL